MLTKVETRTSQGGLLTLPLRDISAGFVIKDIGGLDPVKATIVTSSFAQMPGAQRQSSSRETRNVTIKVELEPNYISSSVRDLRNILYGYFMPQTQVELRFYDTDGLVVKASGEVESCESALFTKEPAVDISIVCFDPDFIELETVGVTGTSTAGSTEQLISYAGSVETGIEFTLNLNRSLSEFTIYHRPPDNTLRSLDFAASLIAGDVLKINTVPGSKGATLTRAGSDSSLLYGVSSESNWIKLMSAPGGNGANYIRVQASGVGIPFGIQYLNRYGGL